MKNTTGSKTFPGGLVQPDGSFRFSADALQLVQFTLQQCKEPEFFADLGTGCGVIALGLLREWKKPQGLGVEREENLLLAAEENAANLGMLARVQWLCLPVEALGKQWQGKANLVTMNPPWKNPEAGRHCPSPLRQRALFAEDNTLDNFLAAATFLLAPQGALAMICGAARLPQVLEKANARGLNPEILQFVHGTVSRNASAFLLKAKKGGKGNLKVLPGLTA